MKNFSLLASMILMTLVIAACGNQTDANPASGNQEAAGGLGQTAVATERPKKNSLNERIIGTWEDETGEEQLMLDFLPDGGFFMNSGVRSVLEHGLTYEIVGDHSIVLTDNQSGSSESIVVDKISDNAMTLLQNPWSDNKVTFRKLKGADNLSVDILGTWLFKSVDSTRADELQAEPPYPIMIFNPDSTFLADEYGTTFRILSSSAIALQNPSWDKPIPIRVEEVSRNEGSFQFYAFDPPFLYKKLQEDNRLQQRLVGLWGDGAMEFISDGRFIDNSSSDIYSYRAYADGVILLQNPEDAGFFRAQFKSDDEMSIARCLPEWSEGNGMSLDCSQSDNWMLRTK